jgi:hypothetical protein
MNGQNPLQLASSLMSRLFQISKRTWYWIAASVFVLIALIIWALVVASQWLFQQGHQSVNDLAKHAPAIKELVVGHAEGLAPGSKQVVDGVLEKLSLSKVPKREVSGTDIVPVPRYPGLIRTSWDQSGVAEYEGSAAFNTVREHYSQGLIALGFSEVSISTTQESEVHEYRKNAEHFRITTAQKSTSMLHIRIEKLAA